MQRLEPPLPNTQMPLDEESSIGDCFHREVSARGKGEPPKQHHSNQPRQQGCNDIAAHQLQSKASGAGRRLWACSTQARMHSNTLEKSAMEAVAERKLKTHFVTR